MEYFKNDSQINSACFGFFAAIFCGSFFFNFSASAALQKPVGAQNKAALPSILKADNVNSDQINSILDATGNAELRRENSVVYADEVFYYKNSGWVKAIGNVKLRNIEVGNVMSSKATLKDDFSYGTFSDSILVMSDGSYLTSPQIERQSPEITVLQSSIYSICPSSEISQDNSLAGKQRDMISIKSQKTTIDRQQEKFKIKNGVVRLYNIPFLYIPYLSAPLPSKGRQSGFLHPSYTKTKFGIGFKTPYYWSIAPNKDLTITPFINPRQNLHVINNEFRHMTSYGRYEAAFEVANNNITYSQDKTIISRSDSKYRWNLSGKGIFDFTKNTGLDFNVNDVYDRNYLRDYHNNYLGYTLSKVNLDYIKGRSYQSVKFIKIQELEYPTLEKASPLIFPIFDSHVETKPLFFKEKLALTSNAAVISRNDGLEYRRATTTPEVNLPFNLKGNLFNINARVQTDIYSLENNFHTVVPTNNYNATQGSYKPEASINWSLPLFKKSKDHTIVIEPIANIVSSYYNTSPLKLPNEDSNNSELTVSNLFLSDRIAGYDRNETGTRTSYGAKTSLYNKYGEYGLTLGQSFKIKEKSQDVAIRGFNNNNKSNFIGLMSYKASKYFNISYAFQLSESNYHNEVNEVNTNIDMERVLFSSNYLFLRRNSQNISSKEQISFSSKVKVTKKFMLDLIMNKDLVSNRLINRTVAVTYDGCCTTFSFSVTENNPSNLIKPTQSYNVSLSFKNL
jgi:LPS-assembly protein